MFLPPPRAQSAACVVVGEQAPQHAVELRRAEGDRAPLDPLSRRVHVGAARAAESERGDAEGEGRVRIRRAVPESVRQPETGADVPHNRDERVPTVEPPARSAVERLQVKLEPALDGERREPLL